MNERVTLAPPAFASLELFHGVPDTALTDVAILARVRRLRKNTHIFEQGDPAERAHALIEGSVRISQSGSDGAEVVVRFIGPGETFGAVALFTDHKYPADAVTASDSIEASWSEPDLLGLIGRHPEIALNVIRIVGRRLGEVQDRVRELSTQRVERRVAHAVLRLANQIGRSAGKGEAIDFPLRRKDVAQISGTTLHTASRILTAWERAGLLVSHNQRITIRDPEGIRRIAEET